MDSVFFVVRKKITDDWRVQGSVTSVYETQRLAQEQVDRLNANRHPHPLLEGSVYSWEEWTVWKETK